MQKKNTAQALPDQVPSIPLADLAPLPIWAAWCEEWKGSKWTKPPRNAKTGGNAQNNNPRTWHSRGAAERRAEKFRADRGRGVGLMLSSLGAHPGWRLCGLDLDGCRNPETGELADWAEPVLDRFASYAEPSPSETGVHVYFSARDEDIETLREAGLIRPQADGKPGAGRNFGLSGEHRELSLFAERKFLTVTDAALKGFDLIEPVSLEVLEWLLAEHGPSVQATDSGSESGAGGRDESGSGAAFRFMQEQAHLGRTEAEAIDAIEADNGPAGEWWGRTDDRQRERATERGFGGAVARREALDALLPEDEVQAPERMTLAEPDKDAISAEELAEIEDLSGEADLKAKAAKQKEGVDRVTGRLNEKHALVRHGAKSWIADFTGHQIELGPIEGLHALYANDLVPTGAKGAMIPSSKHWITSPGRRTYHGIVFDPSGNAPKSALNLYTGLAVQPNPNGSCERIVAHIRDVIAAGNAAHFAYIICWLADLVQNPGQKPGVALVLRGGKGVGKDTLPAEIMGRIIGRKHVAHITRADDLTGRFNAPFATALLVHVEEAFWSGDVSKKGTLQALITARTQPIERKGIDRVEVDSFLRVLMTTNDEWAVPASEDERRYAVFDVSAAHQRDPEWFGPLYEEIETGGPAAFLAYLLSVDLSGFDVRDVPQTEALRDQKLASLRGVPRWWFDVLEKGDAAEFGHFGGWSRPITVEKDAVRGSYEARERQSRFGSDPVNPAVFTKELKRLLGDYLPETRPRVDGKRVCMFVLPPLADCRTKFAEWLQAPVQWGDNDIEEDDDPEADALI